MAEEFVPNPRKTPLKGEPCFVNISDDRLTEYRDFIQDMIFAYKYCDPEMTKVLQKMHKQISVNLTDRINYDKIRPSSEKTVVVKKSAAVSDKVTKLIKKPLNRPIVSKVIKSI